MMVNPRRFEAFLFHPLYLPPLSGSSSSFKMRATRCEAWASPHFVSSHIVISFTKSLTAIFLTTVDTRCVAQGLMPLRPSHSTRAITPVHLALHHPCAQFAPCTTRAAPTHNPIPVALPMQPCPARVAPRPRRPPARSALPRRLTCARASPRPRHLPCRQHTTRTRRARTTPTRCALARASPTNTRVCAHFRPSRQRVAHRCTGAR